MKYLVLFFFFLSSINATPVDIIDLYRTQGIKAVEKEIANQLKTKSYWDQHLQTKEVDIGYYESIEHVVITEKHEKNMKLYDTKTKLESFHLNVFIGKVDGDKKVEGDLKTPIGAYELKRRITNVDPFYGPMAITTNYPNAYDKSQGKTGHGIWIHGLPLNQERDDFTEGCIAIDNEKIVSLDKIIDLKKSILVVSENKLETVSKDDISIVLSNVFAWRDTWKESDIDGYLGFYSDEFKRANGQAIEEFSTFKKKLFKRNEKKTIEFTNINVVPYPNDMNKKLFKVIMDEVYKTRTYQFKGKKELYLEILDSKISILSED
ncbi:MAG: L,D-transpeptidase family protein [Arcobacteraceae bacterium]